MSLEVSALSSLEELGADAWSDLAARSHDASVFQSWDWLSAWWESFGVGEPLILAAREHGKLVGAAAFYVDPGRVVRLIGDQHADYGNVLAAGGRPEIVAALVAGLFSWRFRWSRLVLDAVRLGSLLSLELGRQGARQGKPSPCPRTRFVERSADELLRKSSLRRHARALSRLGPVECLHLETPAAIEPWLDAFVRQHTERWALADQQKAAHSCSRSCRPRECRPQCTSASAPRAT